MSHAWEVKGFLHFTGNFLCRNYLKLLGKKLHIQHKQNSVFNYITLSTERAKEMEDSPSFEYLYTQLVLPQYGEHRHNISASSLQKLMENPPPKKETIPLIWRCSSLQRWAMTHCKENFYSPTTDSNFFLQINGKNPNQDAFHWKY